jgi:hypothetical protein
MRSISISSVESRVYRAALSLCPAGFRRDHGDEMARDFDEARREAADSTAAIWMVRACMSIDFVRTFAVQWVRTKVPVIAAVSIVLALAIAEVLAAIARRASVRMPVGIEHDDAVVVLFMAEILVVLIAMTILISLWVGRLTRPRRR